MTPKIERGLDLTLWITVERLCSGPPRQEEVSVLDGAGLAVWKTAEQLEAFSMRLNFSPSHCH